MKLLLSLTVVGNLWIQLLRPAPASVPFHSSHDFFGQASWGMGSRWGTVGPRWLNISAEIRQDVRSGSPEVSVRRVLVSLCDGEDV
jgi:hypothetical protein